VNVLIASKIAVGRSKE